GFTPKLVGIAWMGFDQPKSLGSGETGGGASMPVWIDYMRFALKDIEPTPPPPMPDGIIQQNGNFYLTEFPPGSHVARVGLSSPNDIPLDGGESFGDGIANLLNQLTGGADQAPAQPEPVGF